MDSKLREQKQSTSSTGFGGAEDKIVKIQNSAEHSLLNFNTQEQLSSKTKGMSSI